MPKPPKPRPPLRKHPPKAQPLAAETAAAVRDITEAARCRPHHRARCTASSTATARASQHLEAPFIEVYGAREHNLKNVSVKIPRNRLVVFTGISGSGK